MKLFLQSPTDYYFPRLSKVLTGCALGMLLAVPVLLLGVPLGWWAYTALTQTRDASHRASAPLSLEERTYYEQRLAEIQRVVSEREAFRAWNPEPLVRVGVGLVPVALGGGLAAYLGYRVRQECLLAALAVPRRVAQRRP